jgi:hypothetical protein
LLEKISRIAVRPTFFRLSYLDIVSKVDSVVGRIVEGLQKFTYILDREERMLDKISMITGIVMSMFCRRTYLGMVSRVDSVVGRMVEDLQRFTYIMDREERMLAG